MSDTITREQMAEKLAPTVEELEAMQYDFSFALREGTKVTDGQAVGAYQQGANLCALSTAEVSARARKYV